MRCYPEPEPQRKPARSGGEQVREAIQRHRERQQIYRLHDAPLPGAEELAASGQDWVIGGLPESPLQPGELLDGVASLCGVNANDLGYPPHVAKVFHHQNEAVGVRVEIPVEQGGHPHVAIRCDVPVEHILAAVQRQPPAEPEGHGVGGGQFDDH